MRLTPPTRSTFSAALLAILAGIVLELDLLAPLGVAVPGRYAFWTIAAGGILLAIGVVFRRI